MNAYVTLLSTPDYLPGVLCLGHALRTTGTLHPLVVGVSASVPASCVEVLEHAQLLPVRLPAESPLPRSIDQHGHHWNRTFDKLHLFGLTDWRKLVYVDSDMLVLLPLDELFERPHLSAVAAGRLVHPEWEKLNSGLMVIEPDARLPGEIGAMLEPALARAQREQHQAVGDQDLIHERWPHWPRSGLQLDEGYNVFDDMLDTYLASGWDLPGPYGGSGRPDQRTIKVVHFTGPVKPWHGRAVARRWAQRLTGRESAARRRMFWLYRHWLGQTLAPAWMAQSRGGRPA